MWTPPAKIEELFAATAGNKFAAINAPTAGARVSVVLPEGPAPVQLYSLGTPNGIKVSIVLEELAIDYGNSTGLPLKVEAPMSLLGYTIL